LILLTENPKNEVLLQPLNLVMNVLQAPLDEF